MPLTTEDSLSGLDCAPEASNARAYGWGETLLVGWPRPWAFAIVRTTPKRGGPVASTADVSVLAIRSKEAAESLAVVLQAVEAFVRSRDLEQVSLAVNTADGEALQQAFGHDFHVYAVVLRMVLEGKYVPPVGRVLGKWLM